VKVDTLARSNPFLQPIRTATTLKPSAVQEKVTVMSHNASQGKAQKLFYIKIYISASFWISLLGSGTQVWLVLRLGSFSNLLASINLRLRNFTVQRI
jgi:hypothetical protein